MKRIIVIFLLFFLGCSPLEISRLLGAGTRPFKEQGKVYTKIFDIDFFSCYEQLTRDLKEMQTSFCRGGRKQGFIVATHFNGVFAQCSEATEVAIFFTPLEKTVREDSLTGFTELDKVNTKVEVTSLNYALAEFVALKLFNDLEEKKTADTEAQAEALFE